MTNDWQNNSDAHTLVLGVFNFIYLMVTVITLLPSSYINEQNFFNNEYGFANVLCSVGLFYSFIEKVLSPEYHHSKKMVKIIDCIGMFLVVLDFACIVLYYSKYNNYWFIWASYILLLLELY